MSISRLRAHLHRRSPGHDTGAAAVEFALVVVPLVLLLFGIIAFGIAFSGWLASNNAARESARSGVVLNRTCEDIAETFISANAKTLGLNTPITVRIERPGNGTYPPKTCVGSITSSGSDWVVSGSWSSGAADTIPCRQSGPGYDQLSVSTSSTSSLFIPLWRNATVPIKGKGTFRCEFS